ncbi:hypothetical protein [Nitrosopumilus sp.]|uniref:hypothetical protein n=1 Tax=Nitrosopumilus sp. TaxID=2024843 RepID=UPI0034A05952
MEMAATCKGICQTFKSIGTSMKLKYQEGQKRCTFCGIFMDFEGDRCPCCRITLRTKARNRISKLNRLESITNMR